MRNKRREQLRRAETKHKRCSFAKSDFEAVPSEALLGSLRDARLRVHSPIMVKFATEGNHIIAEAREFNEFGFGENPSAALIDLQRAIAELYFTLEKERDRLGKDLQGVWSILQEKIHKR